MIPTPARLALAFVLCAASFAAEAVDTFTVRHVSGECPSRFSTLHLPWEGRSRIPVMLGERIRVTLYSHGADLATGVAFNAGVTSRIVNRGTTTDYPNAPIRFGTRVAKGFVTIEITLGVPIDRDVVVRWVTGTESIRLRAVTDCAALVGASYRVGIGGSGSALPTQRPAARVEAVPNVLPQLASTTSLLRKINGVGGPIRVADTFCSGVPLFNVGTVAVPPLVWGASATTAAASGVRVELRNLQSGATLSSFVSGSLPANGATETRQNYAGRPTQVQVIHLGPHVRADFPDYEGVPGCYLHGSAALSLTLDPPAGQLQIVVDPANTIEEGANGEADNALAF